MLQPQNQLDEQLILKEEIRMQITSAAFLNEGDIPEAYTCDGQNINPPLQFTNVPEGTVSLALTMNDPDVPASIRADQNWDHWLVWNMPGETEVISENSTAPGVTGKNTGGNLAYGGPCPPDREHRYFFKVYALDAMLELDAETTTRSQLEAAMEGHILEQAELMGKYNRT